MGGGEGGRPPEFVGLQGDAVDQNEWATLHLRTHAFKGTLPFLGTTLVWKGALQLESVAAGQEEGNTQELLSDLEKQVATLLCRLRRYLVE